MKPFALSEIKALAQPFPDFDIDDAMRRIVKRIVNRRAVRALLKECRFYRDHTRALEILVQVHAKEWARCEREALVDLRYAFAGRNEV